MIRTALKVNAVLNTLDLWENKIGDAGAAPLGEALKVNAVLTKLNLERTAPVTRALQPSPRPSRITRRCRHKRCRAGRGGRAARGWGGHMLSLGLGFVL